MKPLRFAFFGSIYSHAFASVLTSFQIMRLIDAHGLTPDLYSFNSLIKVCRIDNQWRCALAQIREMQSYGIAPDIVSTFGSCPIDVENLSNKFCRLASILLYTQ
jgi:pentatricopeptide repeat protein